MRRPSSPAQLALIDLPPTAASRPSSRRRAHAAWRQAQAATNAARSEALLAEIDRIATSPHPATQPHAADRPHGSNEPPHTAIEWRAEALAELFDAIERAGAPQGNTVRRAAG